MVRDISTSSTLSGANMTLVLLSVVGVVVLCNVGYTFRWVEWCNMTDAPYVDAVKNIGNQDIFSKSFDLKTENNGKKVIILDVISILRVEN